MLGFVGAGYNNTGDLDVGREWDDEDQLFVIFTLDVIRVGSSVLETVDQ